MPEGDLVTEPENYVERYLPPPADPGFTANPAERAMQSTGPFTESEVTATFPKPMSDEQARQDMYRYPSLVGDEKAAADKRFEAYFGEQERRKKMDAQDALQKQLTDPQVKKEFYETPEVKAAAQELKDPNAMYARHVLTNYLENRLGRPLVEGEYEGAKNNLIGIPMNGTPKIDDLSAFGVLQKDAEKDVESQKMGSEVRTDLAVAHFEAGQPGGKPFQIGDVFDKARGAHAELLKEADNERRAYNYVSQENAKMEALFLRNAPQLQTLYGYMKKFQGGVGATTDEEFVAAQEAFRSIPHMDRAQAKALLVDAVKAGDADPTIAKNAMRIISNLAGVPTMYNQNSFAAKEVEIESSRNQILDGTAKVDADGNFVYPGIGSKHGYEVGVGAVGIGTDAEQPNLRKPNEDEIRNELSRLNDQQENNNILNQMQSVERQVRQPHPLSKDGTFWATMERGIYSQNDQVAMQILGFATHRFPLLGHYAYTMLIGNQYFADAMAAEPDMDPRVARASAYIGAAVESVEEQIQWRALKAPTTFKAIFVSMRTGGPVGYLKFLAGHNLIEQTEEAIQDYSTAVIDRWVRMAAQAMDPTMKVGDIKTMEQINKEWLDQRADVAATVFWMSLVTAGFATHAHVHDPNRAIFNDEYLTASGMDQERINTIMTTPDPEKRFQVYRDFMLKRTSEDVARGIEYATNKAAEAAAVVGSTIDQQEGQRPLAGLKSVVVDGERKWQVLDEKGNVVRDSLDADTAMDELDSYQQMLDKEWNLQEATKSASEEEVARQTEAETRWSVLEPRDRTTAGNILEFEHVEPTAQNQAAHDLLQRAVAARNQAGISADNVGLVSVMPPTQAGRSAVNFIRWFERTFGKSVQFVASKDGQPLSFGGLVVKGLPNTIFLDATGDRNLLSVLGHEWSHTLEQTNPKLWSDMVAKMKPMFVDWAKASAHYGKGYDLDQMTPETIANVIGDAFSDPDFWKVVKDRNPSLFQRMLTAISDWFDTIISHASEWGTQSPDIIKDLKGMRDLIAQAMGAAQEGAEVTTPEESTIGAQSALPRPHQVYSEGVSESFRKQDEASERRKNERERERVRQVETDAIVRRRLVESRVTFREAKESLLGRELRRDHGESEERSRELERHVDPDPRLLKKYGTGKVKYDRNGYPIPAEVEEVPKDLLISSDQKTTAVIDHELARELNIRAGEVPRAKLHDAIVRKFINRGDPEKGKYAFLSGGGGGSGKSTLMSRKEGMDKAGREGYVHIDADEIRALLPEYRELIKWRDPRAAELSHEESSALGKRIFGEALAEDLPILYDATFANPKKNIPGIIDKLKEKGYKIRMMGIIVDPHEAIVRAFERAKKTGRYVYPKILLEAHQGFLEAVRDGLYNESLGRESVHIYDNTGELPEALQHREMTVPSDLRASDGEDSAPNVEAATQGQAATPRSYEKMQGAPPRKTVKAYKLFHSHKDGSLRPLFIDKGTGVPTGQWLEAKYLPTEGYAPRPGWHAGVLPLAPHLRRIKTDGMRAPSRVWAEVEMPADIQWQHIADQSPKGDIRGKIPKGGTYRFKVKKMEGGAWMIGGSVKVNRVLSDSEVAKILRKAGQSESDVAAETRGAEGSQAAGRRDEHKVAEKGVRTVDPNGGYIHESEEASITKSINKWLDAKKLTGAIREQRFAEAMDQIRKDVMSTRARNPDATTVAGQEDPWSTLEVTGGKVELITKEGEPDIVKAVARFKKQNYRFNNVPQGMSHDQWSSELANRVMSQYIEQLKMNNADSKLIVQELEWYREFTKKLRQDFGGAADFMADLLGAFSPRQNVQLNFRNAVDAIWAISNGKYDTLLSELDTYLKADPDHTIGTWRDQGGAEMRARSGALFGTNTERGMTAALGLWRAIQAGDAPKAKNFTRNLIALSHKATIDVWAARLLDRVAGQPRIPGDAEGAVSGSHLTETELEKQFGPDFTGEIPVKGQFAFGQDVFSKVAAMMRDSATWEGHGIDTGITDKFKNVTPADVQATNWFVEKAIWTKNGWTNEAGSGGSFIGEIEAMVGTRFQAGLSQARPDFVPNDPEQRAFVTSVRNDLADGLPEVISMRVMDTLGMFKNYPVERSTDLELTHGPGLEPYDLVRTILSHAQQKDQDATHVSRVLEYWEQNENSRPGVEIYLKSERGLEVIQPIMDMLRNSKIDGFTAIVDPRAKGGKFIGVRFQYIPEYSSDGPNWQKKAATIRKTLFNLERAILDMPHVASVRMQEYDTVVFTKGSDYDNTGVYEGALGRSEVAAWRRGYFDSVAEKAVRRNARDVAVEQHEHDVSHREQAEPPAAAGPARAGPVTITAFDSGVMGFEPRQVTPNKVVLKQLTEEAKVYDQILKCLS